MEGVAVAAGAVLGVLLGFCAGFWASARLIKRYWNTLADHLNAKAEEDTDG